MAHPLSQVDAAVMVSGVLLAVSLFALSGGDGMPVGGCCGPRRMMGAAFLNLGKVFWTIWFIGCLLVFTGGLILKFKFHKDYPWKEAPGRRSRHQVSGPAKVR